MDRKVLATAIAVAVIGSGLTACGNDPEASPSPATSISTATTPTPTTATPSATPTPSDDPLFTEAKAVHLKYVAATFRLDQEGGASTLPQPIASMVGGDFSRALESLYADMHRKGIRATPNSSWTRVSAWQIATAKGHIVGLASCVDFRNVTYVKKSDGTSSNGTWIRDELQFQRKNGSLIIVDGSSEQVKSCNAE